jgi:hypothetical protein
MEASFIPPNKIHVMKIIGKNTPWLKSMAGVHNQSQIWPSVIIQICQVRHMEKINYPKIKVLQLEILTKYFSSPGIRSIIDS